MPTIEVKETTYKKLEKLAKGFDTPNNVIERLLEEISVKGAKVNPVKSAQAVIRNPKPRKSLPIDFDPKDIDTFKERLIKTGEATIEIHYQNGNIVSKLWNASRITTDSNIINNLRSRPELKFGIWQKSQIKRVSVTIGRSSKVSSF